MAIANMSSVGRVLWFMSLVSSIGAQSTPAATTTLAAAPSGKIVFYYHQSLYLTI